MIYDLIITSHGVEPMRDGYHKHVDEDLSMRGKFEPERYIIITAANDNKYRVLRDEINAPSIKAFFARIDKRFKK